MAENYCCAPIEEIHCNFFIKRLKRYCKSPLYPNYSYCSRHCEYEQPFKQIEKPDECPICVEKLSEDDKALKCGHWVHKGCIIKSGKSKCPICRIHIYLKPLELRECNRYAQQYRQHSLVPSTYNFVTTLGERVDRFINSYPVYIRQHIEDVGVDNIINLNDVNASSHSIERVLREYIRNSINFIV